MAQFLPRSMYVLILFLISGVATQHTEAWYRSELSTSIIPLYKSACDMLSTHVIQKLTALNIKGFVRNQTAVTEIARDLKCTIQHVLQLLQQAVHHSLQLNDKTELKIENGYSAISEIRT
ncbi:unnamed protein product, partial [Didymodactylos carnosus]